MNIFGIGGPELIAILIIMLIFAGPKRMIHWSYILGQYVAKFRVLWSQTVDVIQKEFDDAGVDIKLPKEPPTRQNLNKAVSDSFKPLTEPLQESLEEVQKDMDSIKDVSKEFKKTASTRLDAIEKSKSPTPESVSESEPSFGTWSGPEQKTPAEEQSNGNRADLGTWSSPSTD